ncbi:hypothetical protein CLPU_1c03710 [Gottschalkia purinilytica]|uniref:Tetratricopeptide repeat protein n=1 Tax=Gottschalkia purinilytica TaxID=1503 RepID=A0A0L0WFJ8_GOTPU|nr:hypothetical protein [Gottschalkia purinilytica]KNF10206.1 hypothetical protein CLPU_1c03710 [Gottschalkia purinilytica]
MKKFWFHLKELLPTIIIAGTVGLILGIKNVELNFRTSIIIFVPLFFIILTVLIIKNIFGTTKLLEKGKYDELIEKCEENLEYGRLNKKQKNAFINNIAVAYHRMGNFIKSKEIFDKIDTGNLDKNLRYIYYTFKIENALLTDKYSENIEEYIKKALDIYKLSSFYPTLAYYEALHNNENKSLEYINNYINSDDSKKSIWSFFNTSLIFDKFIYDIENNYLIGITYLELEKSDLAKEYLLKATKCEYDNYFTSKARELLREI